MALQMKQQTSTSFGTNQSVATTLLELGRCVMKMDKLCDAKKYLEKA